MLKNFTFSVCPVSIYPGCHTRLAVEAEKFPLFGNPYWNPFLRVGVLNERINSKSLHSPFITELIQEYRIYRANFMKT